MGRLGGIHGLWKAYKGEPSPRQLGLGLGRYILKHRMKRGFRGRFRVQGYRRMSGA